MMNFKLMEWESPLSAKRGNLYVGYGTVFGAPSTDSDFYQVIVLLDESRFVCHDSNLEFYPQKILEIPHFEGGEK